MRPRTAVSAPPSVSSCSCVVGAPGCAHRLCRAKLERAIMVLPPEQRELRRALYAYCRGEIAIGALSLESDAYLRAMNVRLVAACSTAPRACAEDCPSVLALLELRNRVRYANERDCAVGRDFGSFEPVPAPELERCCLPPWLFAPVAYGPACAW